jgi:uncharacterized protein DUF5681
MSDDQKENPEAQRDGRGRYVKGVSGNPAGKPAGIMNEATRIAAMILTGSTPVLVHKAIELALNGKTAPLKYCLDRIIAPQRDQPVVFETPPEGDGPRDLAGAMALIAAAAVEGTINPSQAATLCQAFADHARAVETQERAEAQRLAADVPAIWNRFQLRICVALADGVREILDEGGEVDAKIPPLCSPILRVGRRALVHLAQIGDRAELILADEAFVAQHPHPPEDVSLHPLAEEILPLYRDLERYLNRNMDWLDEKVEERFAAREAAGEPDPIYRSWIFQPMEVRAARFARST